MQLVRIDAQSEVTLSPCVATIGNFDGLHLGHQQVLAAITAKAKELQLTPTVITFQPSPQRVLRPQTPLLRLTTFAQKLHLLAQHGIQRVIALRFNEHMQTMTADRFIERLLLKQFQIKHLVVGKNFRFGHQQQGDSELLQQWAKRGDFSCDIMPLTRQASSTAVRQALLAGNCAQAAALLGRPYSITERVIRGKGMATKWGIPTANLPIAISDPGFKGIFVIAVNVDGSDFPGVANLGTRPTMDGKNYLLEAHIFDYSANLYGKRIRVSLLHKLRDEIRFESVDALRQQIMQDIEDAKRYLIAGL